MTESVLREIDDNPGYFDEFSLHHTRGSVWFGVGVLVYISISLTACCSITSSTSSMRWRFGGWWASSCGSVSITGRSGNWSSLSFTYSSTAARSVTDSTFMDFCLGLNNTAALWSIWGLNLSSRNARPVIFNVLISSLSPSTTTQWLLSLAIQGITRWSVGSVEPSSSHVAV